MYRSVAIFVAVFALYFCKNRSILAQSVEPLPVIEFSATEFLIERPFTISVIIPQVENRPTIAFPDILGLTKQGTSTSATRTEVAGREVISQVVTQTYAAIRPGTLKVAPFAITVNGQTIRSAGTTLIIRTTTPPVSASALAAKIDKKSTLLITSVSQPSIFVGEGLRIDVAVYVAENYPYELHFDKLAPQVEAMARQLRPVNAWEENDNISELTPRPATYNGRRYIRYLLYQATFFPLSGQTTTTRTVHIPALRLMLTQSSVKPTVVTNASQPQSVTASEPLVLTSLPADVTVRPLPPHPLRERVSVGQFRLVDEVDRQRVVAGQSIRFDIRVEGRGQIAGIQAPTQTIPEHDRQAADLDVFPPTMQEQIGRANEQVSGYKRFRYFLIPKQKGVLTLANRFFWVYFDPQTGRYDTLRPQTVLSVINPGDNLDAGIVPADTVTTNGRGSVYSGLEQTDSTQQSINMPVLVRSLANVLIILMILGTLYVYARKT
ncbi:BatD family protein [Fibrella sp. HMF5335]|uniref:BatD family protein n=1 Tax=Fibrella rubiginis TaxID=2817060 RepID=A0A939K3W6_9BACT|nr:BatD family protein [Fibrella rubiginis]MBO0937809.1 BatD family protein [Fibrella rubiginis]